MDLLFLRQRGRGVGPLGIVRGLVDIRHHLLDRVGDDVVLVENDFSIPIFQLIFLS